MKRLLLLPSAQKSAQSDQLPEMVCVMVGDQQGLAQDGLAIAPGNWCIEVGSGISYQVVYRLEVFSKRLNAVVPCGCVGRRLCFRPVALRPRRRYVLAITASSKVACASPPLTRTSRCSRSDFSLSLFISLRHIAKRFGGRYRCGYPKPLG